MKMMLNRIVQRIENFNFQQWAISLDRRYKLAFLSIFLWGILAHGMTMFDYLAHHDDIAVLTGFGRHYVSVGRWFTSFLALLEKHVITTSNTIYPLPYCLFSVFFLGLLSCFLIYFFNIRKLLYCVLISCVLVVYPTVTSTFGYLHIAPYFMLSAAMAAGGSILCCRKGYNWHTVVGIILMVLSIAIYQAFIPFMLSIFLLFIVKEIIDNPEMDSNRIVSYACKLCISFICVSVLYILSLKMSLIIAGVELTSYKGANNWNTNILDHILRIPIAYYNFFIIDNRLSFVGLEFFKGQEWYNVFLFIFLGLIANIVIHIYKVKKTNAIFLVAIFCVLPLAICSIYVLCPIEVIHTPMLYSNVLVFVFFLFLLEKVHIKHKALSRVVKGACVIVFSILNIIFIKFDNACYMKAIFNKQRAISYFTTLITQIKSTKDYTDEMKVVFINDNFIKDKNIVNEFSYIQLSPYWGMDHYLNDYVWFLYMVRWCGYQPQLANKKDFENLSQVRSMPAYPDFGSIAVINNTVVVKLGNNPK